MMNVALEITRELSALSEAGIANVERNDADARLVARIRAGDDDAFETLVGQYQAPLFRYLRGFVGDAEQARDLVQETFLRAYKSLGSLEDPALLRSWLYRIAHNQACSVLRRRRLISWLPLLPAHQTGGPSPDRSAIEAARVEEALGRVPTDQRAPLLMHLVAGFSYAEIAALLNVTEGTVRMRISRGRAAFRAAYGAREDDDAS
jgi:RNA polymerase sigma-70 factor (ECF subfamily)